MERMSLPLIHVEQLMQADPASARLPHDEKYEDGSVFVNEKYGVPQDLVIPFFDAGFTHSDMTYEVATVSRGRFFRLQDHFQRFARSCESFRLQNPHTNEEMTEIFNRLLGLAGFKDAWVWWCVTRGAPKPGASAARDRNKPEAFQNRFYATVVRYPFLATHEQRSRGFDILVSKRYVRIPPKAVDPTAKNAHWMDMKLALFEARDLGKDSAVLTDVEGYLTECPAANIFVVKDGELYTPDSGCLLGITRKATLELAEMMRVRVHVEKVHVNQLKDADEAFMTSSCGGITPINSVDDIVLGGVAGAGELSIRLHNLYWEKMREGWKCTPVDYEIRG